MVRSRKILLRTVSFSDKICRENQNTFYIQYFFFRKSCCLLDYAEKYDRARLETEDNMAPESVNGSCPVGCTARLYDFRDHAASG